jgi:hypothetical protein
MKLVLILIFCTQSAIAIATADSSLCVDVKRKPFRGHIPKNFILVPPCLDAYVPEEGSYPIDEYLFVGDATITGNVMYQDTETYGPHPIFQANKQFQSLLPERTWYFHLKNSNAIAFSNLKLPKLDAGSCLTAPASIRIRKIYIINDGSDSAGASLPEYTVLHIGEYVACK